MVNTFTDLFDLLGNHETAAGQLFMYNIIGALVSQLTLTLQRSIGTRINENDPNQPLSPAEAADLVLKGYLDQTHAAQEAALSGINFSRFDQMVKMAGDAPGPGELAEALRREFIPRRSGTDDGVGYEDGIAQSRLRNKWAPIIEKLDYRLPGIEAAVTALVRSMVSDSTARSYFHRFGGDLEFFDLLYDIAGEGPSPVEAGVLLNRGFIAEHGTGPESTSFEQAVAESRFKNKWTEAYRKLREYRPPPRTIQAMLREGSIDRTTAITWLKDYGVTDDKLDPYLTKSTKTQTQKAKELTETEIVKLYEEQVINRDKATELLQKARYDAEDIALILSAADIAASRTLLSATIAVVKNLYLHHRVTRNEATTRLDRAGILSTYRDRLFDLWDLELEAGIKSLTETQVIRAVSLGFIQEPEAIDRLTELGYSLTDAKLLIDMATQLPPNSPSVT